MRVVVAGAGPAGLAVAAACAARGLDVSVVAPAPRRRWPQHFGLWRDEARDGGLDGALARTWPVTAVQAGPHERLLARGYALLDNDAAQRSLARHVERHDAAVVAVDARGVALRGGGRVDADAVVDATGHAPALVRRSAPLVFQSAYGIVARFSRPPALPGAATLLDYRAPTDAPQWRADPTFLYALDLGDGRWLAEETSLLRHRPMPGHELERRLRTRLSAQGTPPGAVERTERSVYPMGGRPPPPHPLAVPFGAAAQMVHPASGYHVGGAVKLADPLAAALAAALADGAGPRRAAAAGQAVVHGAAARQRHALHRLGARFLLGRRLDELQGFFATFFGLPEPRWRAYLSTTSTPAEVRAAMRALVASAPALTPRLAGSALTASRAELAEGLGLRTPRGAAETTPPRRRR